MRLSASSVFTDLNTFTNAGSSNAARTLSGFFSTAARKASNNYVNLFEIPVLAIVNEVYFRRQVAKPDYEEGRRRLAAKIRSISEDPQMAALAMPAARVTEKPVTCIGSPGKCRMFQVGAMSSSAFTTARTCGFHNHDDPDNGSFKGSIVIQ